MYKRTYKRKNKALAYSFTNKEYSEFLSRLRGCLIFRGKSSLSYKWMDKIFFKFKRTFGINTDFLFRKVLKNLIPFIGYRKVKMGKKVNPLPILLRKSKRQIILMNWLLKDTKNKSNVRGYKFKDLWENLYDGIYSKGAITDKKDDYFDKSLDFLYLLKKRRWRRGRGKQFTFKSKPFRSKRMNKRLFFRLYRKGRMKPKKNQYPVSFLLSKFCKVKYAYKRDFNVKRSLRLKTRKLWLRDVPKVERSKIILDFLYKNRRYFNWFYLNKNRTFSKYLRTKNAKQKIHLEENKWKKKKQQ